MINKLNILIAGVGGQGTLVAGKLFGKVALLIGLDVKVSEVHGMSQRGGSVVTHVRIGEHVFSPVIEKGSADFILAFEELEALRCVDYLSDKGKLIINKRNIMPATVIAGKATYPKDIPAMLSDVCVHQDTIISLDAEEYAHLLGNIRTANIIMIGAMSVFTDIDESFWINAITDVFPEKLRDINIKAFRMGREKVI